LAAEIVIQPELVVRESTGVVRRQDCQDQV